MKDPTLFTSGILVKILLTQEKVEIFMNAKM